MKIKDKRLAKAYKEAIEGLKELANKYPDKFCKEVLKQ